jgi:hypothetical protein
MNESNESSQFESYHEEFQSLLQQLETASDNDEIARSTAAQQCHDMLQQMALEARGCDNGVLKRELLQTVKQEKSRLQALELSHQKQSLMAGSGALASSNPQRNALQQTETKLTKQNETLERARRSMQETEEIGMEVTHELAQNRAKIESSAQHTEELTLLTDQAGKILHNMSKPWWRR